MRQLLSLLPRKSTPPRPRRNPTPAPQPSPVIAGRTYILMPQTNTYAAGVHALHEACVAERNPNHPKYNSPAGERYRPLTFKEGMKARVEDFNRLKNSDGRDRTLDDRLVLFNSWNDSCTGIGYQKDTGKFKIIPICGELITIDRGFTAGAISIDYSAVQGAELDRARGKYNTALTQLEIENHEAWRAAFEGDVPLLKEYRDVVFAAYQEKHRRALGSGMAFYLRDNPDTELRALLVFSLDNSSVALGDSNLDSNGSFVRVAPSQKNSP